MLDSTSTTKPVSAVSITITRAEGPHALCDVEVTFKTNHGGTCWDRAHPWLVAQSSTFPTRGCDKHDFSVKFSDGYVYSGRLDCKAAACEDPDLDVAQHVRQHCEIMAGMLRPAWMTDKQWARALKTYANDRARYVEFLYRYEIPRASTID